MTTTTCEACGTANRANANFCIGCAAKLPGFAATGPSALESLPAVGKARALHRVPPAADAAPWRPLLVGGLLAALGFMAWYMQVTRAPAPIGEATRTAPVVLEPAFQLVGPIEPDTALLPEVSATARAAAERSAQWAAMGAAETAPTATPAPPAAGAIETVTAFYRALASGDGDKAATFVTASKRTQGPLSGAAMAAFYRSLSEPLSIRSVTQLDDRLVEARYTYRATRSVCNGRALVALESSGPTAAIRSISANC